MDCGIEEEFLNRKVVQIKDEENTKVSFIIGDCQHSDDTNESLDEIEENSEYSPRSNLSTSSMDSTHNGSLDHRKTLFKNERRSTRKRYPR